MTVASLRTEILQRACTKPLNELSATAARNLCDYLYWLTPWVLRPEVLENAEYPTKIEQKFNGLRSVGACWIIVAIKDPECYPLLRPAFPFPVRWEPGKPHSDLLPGSLCNLADSVLAEVPPSKRGQDTQRTAWGLQPWHDALDLSELESLVSWDSGWASLAGGLMLAREDVRPDPRVWASGCWRPRYGVGAVDHLKPKLEIAKELGAEVFWLPEENRHACEEHAQALGLPLQAFGIQNEAPQALRPYQDRLIAQPGHAHELKERRSYYVKQSKSSLRADTYFRTHLLEDLTKQYRDQLDDQIEQIQGGTLVAIVSGAAPVLIPLSARVFRPSRILLLHTTNGHEPFETMAKAIHKALEDPQETLTSEEKETWDLPLVHRRQFDRIEDLVWEIPDIIHAEASNHMILDLTYSTKLASLAMVGSARSGDWLCDWNNSGDSRLLPDDDGLLLNKVMGPVDQSISVFYRRPQKKLVLSSPDQLDRRYF